MLRKSLRDGLVVGDQGSYAVTCRSWQLPAELKMSRSRQWCLIALLLLSFLAGCFLLYRSQLLLSPDHLIAKAYFEQRPLELRINGARHSPLRVQRGQANSSDHSRMDRPPSLLEAEARIARGLRRNPEDLPLLTVRGQANLLEWSYEAAITDMQEALDTQPKSAPVLNGLATAYFERAEAEDRFGDYGTAFELQSRALQQSPDDTIILFNRAITAARLFLFKQSIEDWQRYVSLDPTGEWSEEGKQHLREVQEIVDAHDKRTRAPLLTPAEFVHVVDASDPKTWDAVEPRIEEYLSVATTDWLPMAFPVDESARPSEEAKRALGVLALILKSNHSDSWLSDLLSASVSHEFALAVRALKEAIGADNITEDYALGRKESVRAARLFAQASNSAGEARALFEEAYSLAFANDGTECLKRITRVFPLTLAHSYRWIGVQLGLEQYACSTQSSNVDLSPPLTRSASSAQESRYPALTLRAMGFLADEERLKGRGHEAWKICHQGLQKFWSSTTYPMPGYNLYSVMDVISETNQSWHLDTSIDEEALTLVSDSENPLMLAVEHASLAHAAMLASQPDVAENNLRTAALLLGAAPPGPITEEYGVSVAIYEARLAAVVGHASEGADRLTTIRPQVAKIANENVLSEYHRTFGEVETLDGNFGQAEREFSEAVSVAERQRASIRSESDRLAWPDVWVGLYRELVAAKLHSGDSRGALAVWELYRGAELRAASPKSLYPTSDSGHGASISSEQLISDESALLNQTLPALDHRTVLVYSLMSDGLAIWAYDDRGITERLVQKNPADLKMLADHLRELCATPSSSPAAIRSIAARLYRILIDPVADYLRPSQTLIIELDDALSGVPFQVLQDEEGGYLADRHPVLYSPAFRYLTLLRSKTRRIDAEMKALVVASAAGSIADGLRPIPDVLREAKGVAQRFAGAELLIEQEASLRSVLRDLPLTEVFHFAGHTGSRDGRVGLLLDTDRARSEPSVFDSSVVDHMTLPDLQLAVLSACSTEAASDSSIRGSASLARAFLRKGVPSVLATRWNVDSESSTAIARTFYDRLLSGEAVAQALAGAEADLRQRYSHPYYWAGFEAWGQD